MWGMRGICGTRGICCCLPIVWSFTVFLVCTLDLPESGHRRRHWQMQANSGGRKGPHNTALLLLVLHQVLGFREFPCASVCGHPSFAQDMWQQKSTYFSLSTLLHTFDRSSGFAEFSFFSTEEIPSSLEHRLILPCSYQRSPDMRYMADLDQERSGLRILLFPIPGPWLSFHLPSTRAISLVSGCGCGIVHVVCLCEWTNTV